MIDVKNINLLTGEKMGKFPFCLLVLAALTESNVALSQQDQSFCPSGGENSNFAMLVKSKNLDLRDQTVKKGKLEFYVSGIYKNYYDPKRVKSVDLGSSPKTMFGVTGYDSSKQCFYVMKDVTGADLGPIVIAPKLP